MNAKAYDQHIREEIEASIRPKAGERGIDFSGVRVTVEASVVTLAGRVPDLEVYEAADLIARQVPGVVSVVNRLEIHRPITDEQRDVSLVRAVVDAFGPGHRPH